MLSIANSLLRIHFTNSMLVRLVHCGPLAVILSVLNVTPQLIRNSVAHATCPEKIFDLGVATVELSNHKRHGMMLLYI